MEYIACYGDSLVEGFPYGARHSWTAAVEKASAGKIRMLNYGLCGDCCDDILFRLRQYALPPYVKNILFLGGANDIIQGRKLEAITDDFLQLIAWCAEKNFRLCIVLPLISADAYLNRRLLDLRQALQHAAAGKALLLDLQPAIGSESKELKAAYLDGVHPLAKTYEAMGNYAAPYLAEWLHADPA